jgi:hypothetical protein
LVVTFMLGSLRGPGCGDLDSPSAGVNAPCTRDHDCHAHLACVRGVCDDGTRDAGDGGAGVSGPADVDASAPDDAPSD